MPEYEAYRAYYLKDDYNDLLTFAETTDAACLAYGDLMGVHLSKKDDYVAVEITEDNSSYLQKGHFNLAALSGDTYREDWFGGDVLSYVFPFKNTTFSAASLACPLEDLACDELRDEAFIKSLLNTLH
ncbi:hypothetical protein IPG41_04260 [Candidatus Peregrinibacteria bacterium]|nr:MAG: hypothetical protein IPG41_04260 [Candidatus Peregrinibacteria bacterium]